ncbi:hypothetical protein H8356DRAFT_1072129 [Neocallimastix lanati (nom. inval.)]|uniref:Uncharacterized protein n=1 Tax=Neocallimastix californiae TaxID=1754190 RepID=A0A1Y2FTB8_9FUNG|nr:hypothetical protein H8356DRAFT_1072129 [Neocallimastix sp. JGI-2020a]ORY87189.1 hypothetical protein LY90DRAFT_498441 [Neocallimastix californiae]|eukprot:ORY87189.1 hypothetical protein LY90DRAFT_498441 [Neocallimastix californiae]
MKLKDCYWYKKGDNNHNSGKDFGTRSSNNQNYFKDSHTTSNNQIPKTTLLAQDEPKYEKYEPEAKISNLHTREELQNLKVLYNTGLKINMIHPQLAKEMGIQIKDRPLTFTTATGKVLIPQVTKEFQIKVKLVKSNGMTLIQGGVS